MFPEQNERLVVTQIRSGRHELPFRYANHRPWYFQDLEVMNFRLGM